MRRVLWATVAAVALGACGDNFSAGGDAASGADAPDGTGIDADVDGQAPDAPIADGPIADGPIADGPIADAPPPTPDAPPPTPDAPPPTPDAPPPTPDAPIPDPDAGPEPDAPPPPDAPPALPDIVITELLAIPGGAQTAELIELHNAGATAVDVRGFVFANEAGEHAGVRATTDLDGTGGAPVVIPPGGYAFGVANPTGGVIPAGAAFVYGDPGTGFDLADAGDRLTLTAGGFDVDEVDFRAFATDPTAPIGAAAFPGIAGRSTQVDRDLATATGNDDGGHWCIPFRAATTAGAANGDCDVAVINELLYDTSGTDDGNTFIEIAGPGGSAVLGGGRVEDIEGSGNSAGEANQMAVAIPAGTRIPVDGLLVIADGNAAGATTVANADLVVPNADFENGPGEALQLVTAGNVLLDALAHTAMGAQLPVTTGENGLAIVEGTPALSMPGGSNAGSSLCRSVGSIDTNDNRADFIGDPSPSPGLANPPIHLAIIAITPDNAVINHTDPNAKVTIVGTDFRRTMTMTLGGGTTQTCTPTSEMVATCNLPVGMTPGRITATFTNPANMGGQTATIAFTYTDVANETDAAGELDFCNLQSPLSTMSSLGSPTETIFGRVYETGVTESSGPASNVIAQLGFGSPARDPRRSTDWRWFPATYNTQVGNDDEYQATITAPVSGVFRYTYRVSLDGGLTFTYCDSDGAGSNLGLVFDPMLLGSLNVMP